MFINEVAKEFLKYILCFFEYSSYILSIILNVWLNFAIKYKLEK